MNMMRAKAIDWLDENVWDLGITLTFKHDVSELRADKAIGHMWNRVDRALYGNAAKRYGKQVERVNVFEKTIIVKTISTVTSESKCLQTEQLMQLNLEI